MHIITEYILLIMLNKCKASLAVNHKSDRGGMIYDMHKVEGRFSPVYKTGTIRRNKGLSRLTTEQYSKADDQKHYYETKFTTISQI